MTQQHSLSNGRSSALYHLKDLRRYLKETRMCSGTVLFLFLCCCFMWEHCSSFDWLYLGVGWSKKLEDCERGRAIRSMPLY